MSRIASYGQALLRSLPFDAFTRDIWLLCISNMIGAFGEGLYFWVFPLYIKSLQADYVQIGLVFSTLYGASALTLLLGGLLADRFDRKKVLIVGWTPWVLAPLIYSFASAWQQLILGAICWGVSMMGVPAANAYIITSIKDRKKIATALSFVWSSYSFSYIFAPSVGGYLATVIDMRWVLRISALLTAVATGVFFMMRSQYPQKRGDSIQGKRERSSDGKSVWRKILVWSVFSGLVTFFMNLGKTFVPTFLAEEVKFSEFYVGLFGSISYAGVTLIGIAMGYLGDRWRKSRAISLCLLFFGMSMVPLFLVREVSVLMFMAFFFGGSVVTGTLVSSLVGSIAPEDRRGFWLSVPLTFNLVAAFIAPYLAGYLYTLNIASVFLISVSAILVLILYALVKLKE